MIDTARSPATGGARLWIVRHARPLVEPGLCYGALDMPADTTATQTSAVRLAAVVPLQAQVFHSPLRRCQQLAFALQALRPDLVPQPDARLQEMDFGTWEGQAWAAIGKASVDTWIEAFATYPPGDGENLSSMLARVSSALHSARDMMRQAPAGIGAGHMVWITHAGVARCVAWLQAHGSKAIPSAEKWPVSAPALGEWEIHDL